MSRDDPVIDRLLQPISATEPCGLSMLHDAVFTDIRLAREEDDPHLPMGQWDRPLRFADWSKIESCCVDTLSTRTKDLQLVGWLTEAWTRQSGLSGLLRGLHLFQQLTSIFWESIHPRIEDDGDVEPRLAPFQWLNEALVITLKVHMPLLTLKDHKPASITFADWEWMTVTELKPQQRVTDAVDPQDEPPMTRQWVAAHVRRHGASQVQLDQLHLHQAQSMLDLLINDLRRLMVDEAPNLSKLKDTLETMDRIFESILEGVHIQANQVISPLDHEVETHADSDKSKSPDNTKSSPLSLMENRHEITNLPVTSIWQNREQAYATLQALADYLAALEPHSPTPYLIRRAVNWGRLPLPELMTEIMQEEGDLNRLVQLLGLSR